MGQERGQDAGAMGWGLHRQTVRQGLSQDQDGRGQGECRGEGVTAEGRGVSGEGRWASRVLDAVPAFVLWRFSLLLRTQARRGRSMSPKRHSWFMGAHVA